jgi:hypothetical protein
MTPTQVSAIENIRDTLPLLEPHDRDYVMGHAVALETAGIENDASREYQLLSRLIQQFGWRLAYCRYVERCVAAKKKASIVTYEEWKARQTDVAATP